MIKICPDAQAAMLSVQADDLQLSDQRSQWAALEWTPTGFILPHLSGLLCPVKGSPLKSALRHLQYEDNHFLKLSVLQIALGRRDKTTPGVKSPGHPHNHSGPLTELCPLRKLLVQEKKSLTLSWKQKVFRVFGQISRDEQPVNSRDDQVKKDMIILRGKWVWQLSGNTLWVPCFKWLSVSYRHSGLWCGSSCWAERDPRGRCSIMMS